ncbi:MAG: nicotianamine synthase family protein [Myxococcota bacterium]
MAVDSLAYGAHVQGFSLVGAARELSERWLCELASNEVYGTLAARHAQCRRSNDGHALAPGAAVNQALERLVAIVSGGGESTRDAMLRPLAEAMACGILDEIPEWQHRARVLRRASAIAETQLEFHFARRICTFASRNPDPNQSLATRLQVFPYVGNYLDLVHAELAAWSTAKSRPRQVVVGGSGPLPMTGLCLAQIIDAPIVLLDRDPAAVKMSSRLLAVLERVDALPAGRVQVVQGSVEQVFERFDADVVIVASLVDDAGKRALAEAAVRRNQPTQLVFRGARGLAARLAYRALPPLTETGLVPLGSVVPEQYGALPDEAHVRRSPRGVLNTVERFSGGA